MRTRAKPMRRTLKQLQKVENDRAVLRKLTCNSCIAAPSARHLVAQTPEIVTVYYYGFFARYNNVYARMSTCGASHGAAAAEGIPRRRRHSREIPMTSESRRGWSQPRFHLLGGHRLCCGHHVVEQSKAPRVGNTAEDRLETVIRRSILRCTHTWTHIHNSNPITVTLTAVNAYVDVCISTVQYGHWREFFNGVVPPHATDACRS